MTEIYRLAKVTAPKGYDIIPRRRLLDTLEKYHQENVELIMLIGEAGYGKTALAADFVNHLNAKVAWYDLEQPDQDFAQFLTFLIYAVQQVIPVYKLEQSEYNFSFLNIFQQSRTNLTQEKLASSVVQKLADAFAEDLILFRQANLLPPDQDLWLVLDNYLNGQSHASSFFLEKVLHWQLGYFRVIIIARTLPQEFPFVELRLTNRAKVIGPVLLRFEQEDAVTFLTNKYPELEQEVIQRFYNLTQGWAVALRLMLASLEQSPIFSQTNRDLNERFNLWLNNLERLLPASGTGTTLLGGFQAEVNLEPFLNYLTATFLDQQPPALQLFMQQTSLLEALSVEICQQLTGLSSAECLEHINVLATERLLLSSLDSKAGLFKYHSLVGGFLQISFSRRQPVLYQATCAKAAAIYESLDKPELAVTTWLNVGQSEEAARVVANVSFKMLESNRFSGLEDLMKKIPANVLQKTARLLHAKGLLQQENGETDKAVVSFKQAIELYELQAEPGLTLKARADLAFTLAATFHPDEAKELAEEILPLCQAYGLQNLRKLDAEKEWIVRAEATTYLALGTAYMRWKFFEQAETFINKADKLFRLLGDTERSFLARTSVANIYRAQGKLFEAQLIYRKAIGFWEGNNNINRLISVRHYMATIDRISGNYSQAVENFKEVLRLATEIHQLYILPYTLCEIALCYTGLADYATANQYFERARQEAQGEKLAGQEIDVLLGQAVNYWLGRGQPGFNETTALNLCRQADFLIKEYNQPAKEPAARLTTAFIKLERQNYREATLELEQAFALLQTSQDTLLQARCLWLCAVARYQLNEDKVALLEKLAESVTLAQPNNDLYYPYTLYEVKVGLPLLQFATQWFAQTPASKLSVQLQFLADALPALLDYYKISLSEMPVATTPPTQPTATTKPKVAPTDDEPVHFLLKGLEGGQVLKNGELIQDWEWSKSRRLLFFLAEKRQASIEAISEVLWPEADDWVETDNKLYSVVSDLRKTLKYKKLITVKDRVYRLQNDLISYDVPEFEKVARRLVSQSPHNSIEDLTAAIEMHAEPFLSSFSDEWVERRRTHLLGYYTKLLNELAQRYKENKRYFEALETWQKILNYDITDPDANDNIIQCYEDMGREKAAREHQKRYEDALSK